jgi:plasmid maintenance system antidote protein VapI
MPATALRLARYFGTTPDFWLNLQTAYDLKIVQREIGHTVEREVGERRSAA